MLLQTNMPRHPPATDKPTPRRQVTALVHLDMVRAHLVMEQAHLDMVRARLDIATTLSARVQQNANLQVHLHRAWAQQHLRARRAQQRAHPLRLRHAVLRLRLRVAQRRRETSVAIVGPNTQQKECAFVVNADRLDKDGGLQYPNLTGRCGWVTTCLKLNLQVVVRVE